MANRTRAARSGRPVGSLPSHRTRRELDKPPPFGNRTQLTHPAGRRIRPPFQLGNRQGRSFYVPDRDQNGYHALSDLRSRGLNGVANAVAQSNDHILGFFTMLRGEGSEIAPQIIRALLEFGVRVLFVTHLFDLSHGFWAASADSLLFLRPERRDNGERAFRLLEGEPLPTSYAPDLYRQVFDTAPGAVMALSRADA